jgi:thiamine monophosphate kinase
VEASEFDEFGPIGRIKKRFAANTEKFRLGIGDNGAIPSLKPGNEVVAAVDLLVEGILFDPILNFPKRLGKRSSAVDRKDITIIEGSPLHSRLSLAVLACLAVESLDEFAPALLEYLDPLGMPLVGGQPSVSNGQLFINRSARGLRSGIRKSDRPFTMYRV